MVVIRHDVAEGTLGSQVLDSVHRALRRPEGSGFLTSLMRSVEYVDIQTLAGVYLGKGTTYNVDLKRLERVVSRTLLGLYFRETGVRLPDTHAPVVYSAARLEGVLPEKQDRLVQVVRTAASGRVRVLGNGVFTYALQRIPDELHCSVWVFLFYGQVAFVGLTVRRKDLVRT